MMKDGVLSFETQLKIEFLPLNNSSKKCLEKFLQLNPKRNSPPLHELNSAMQCCCNAMALLYIFH